jgi:Spy/CpxP family protein refolding chaperone
VSVSKTAVIAAIVVVLAFVAGFAAGVVTDHLVMLRRGPGMPPMVAHAMAGRLDRHLDLTDEQRRKIEEILERRHGAMDRLWAEMHPRMRVEIDATNAEIERVLTPEQREKFREMRMRLGPRHGEGRRHRGDRSRRESTR